MWLQFGTDRVPKSSLEHPRLPDRRKVANRGKANGSPPPSESAIVGAIDTLQIVDELAIAS